jgi:hypothetical protein
MESSRLRSATHCCGKSWLMIPVLIIFDLRESSALVTALLAVLLAALLVSEILD